jgi:protein arginine N-methyltransferase 3
MIKLVNYIRSETKKGNVEPDVSSIDKFSNDCYLKPVLENDAVLFSLGDLNIRELDHLQAAEHATAQGDAPQGDDVLEDSTTLKKKIRQLEDELSAVSQGFKDYRNAVLRTLGRSLFEDDPASNTNEKPKDTAKADEKPQADMANGNEMPNGDAVANSDEKPKDNTADSKEKSKDDDYFDAYAYNGRIPSKYPHVR